MTREEVFEAWAPLGGTGEAGWSDWVKPVLFAQMPNDWPGDQSTPMPPERELPKMHGAVVVDLPGELSVEVGLALARQGFRPVPLYNAAADGSGGVPMLRIPGSGGMGARINMWPIMAALWLGADALRRLPIAPDAPPAFLLDSQRRVGEREPGPGMLDNRWMSFPTDFPSARMLLDRGIREAVVIMQATEPATDLGHTLRRWQEGGIVIRMCELGMDAAPREITVSRPGMFGAAWYQFLTMFGLRRSLLGGFGGRLPQPSSG